MTFVSKLTCLLASLFSLSGDVGTAKHFSFFEPVRPPRALVVITHRGSESMVPPCTKPALEQAIGDQLEWISVDVHLTADGKHVLFPNANLDGISDGKGTLAGRTLAQLQQLDVGGWFAPRFRGEQILTLRAGLELAKGRINLLLKCQRIDPAELVREISAASMQKQVIVADGLENLARVRETSHGSIAVLAKWRSGSVGITDFLRRHRPAVVEIEADQIRTSVVEEFHAAQVKLMVDLSNARTDQPNSWERAVASRIDWLQTSVPEEVVVWLISKRLPTKPIMISLHRGASRYAPENTLPAYQKALRLHADYIEFDTRTTNDGVVFLLHDATLDRTTNGAGSIRSHTAKEVESLDAGSKFARPFAKVAPPRFDEFLKSMTGRTNLYVDSKDIAPQALIDALIRHQCLPHATVYGSKRFLKEVKRLHPNIRVMPSLAKAGDLDSLIEELHPHAVDAKWGILSRELITKCHARNVQVFSDALAFHEKIEDYQRAIAWEIDVIQTDQPLRVWRALELSVSH